MAALLAAVYAARSARHAQRQANAAETAVAEAASQTAVARDALSEARSQNRIAVHNERLQIYKALIKFRRELTAKGVHFKDDHIWAFWEHVQIAEFYFPQDIATELEAIVRTALSLQSSRSEWSEDASPSPEKKRELVKKTYGLLDELRKRAEDLDPLIRKELQLIQENRAYHRSSSYEDQL